jgi:hypothetical protein
MKQILQLFTAMVVMATMTGCATPYMIDRARDAKDIVTVSFGVGIGAKARVGPVQLPMIIALEGAGLRSGEFFPKDDSSLRFPRVGFETAQLIPISMRPMGSEVLSGIEDFNPGGHARERLKDIEAMDFVIITFDRNCFSEKPIRWSYFTQIEACVAAGPGIRLGFNPGELLDFVLGWFGIDMFNDDLEARRQKETLKPPSVSGEAGE